MGCVNSSEQSAPAGKPTETSEQQPVEPVAASVAESKGDDGVAVKTAAAYIDEAETETEAPQSETVSAAAQEVSVDVPSGDQMRGSEAEVPPVIERPHTEDKVDPMRKLLGDGPMRFHPESERPLSVQIDSLTKEERVCLDDLKDRWNKTGHKHEYSDKMILRFARCSPGLEKFNAKAAFKVMESFDPRFLSLTAQTMESQLCTKTLFVLPELKSIDGHDVFYMKPARYFPKQTRTATIIDNLVYCMQTMAETKEKSCEEGIAFLANMDDWSFTNFSVSYCQQFMLALQGRVPIRVRMFLIVNPPSWFGSIWSIMKGMLSDDFRKKVAIIPESDLGTYLASGYEKSLPDDMKSGEANTDDIIDDFIDYRKYVEGRGRGA